MAELEIVEAVAIEGEETGASASHTISLVEGEPDAVDGVRAVITVQITDPERDAATLLRAAEQLLPIHREAPGIIITDEEGAVVGIAPRPGLEEAVLRMRGNDYVALAEGLGLRTAYRPPAGLITAPFVYWECPACGHIRVPQEGHEDDAPPDHRAHKPPVRMERRVHGTE